MEHSEGPMDTLSSTILMDLSKAFACIQHDLLLAKLRVYGVTQHPCNLLASYLSNRYQRVKLGDNVSYG